MTLRRALFRIVAAAGLGALVAGVSRRAKALAPVATELRSPALLAPISISNPTAMKIARRAATQPTPLRAGVTTRDDLAPSAAGDVRVIVYEPFGRQHPSGALLWIHGGGLVMGAPEYGHDVCSHVASELDAVVVSVDYRLAPEHPFPAGLDDCFAVLEWMHDSATRLGIDPARIAVGGDSAGGGLAACVAQMAHDRGNPPLAFQLLQYPMLDDRTALRTDAASQRTLIWSNRSNRFAWSAYLGHEPTAQEDRPYAAASRRDDLVGLPPAWIGVGTIDLFHDEDVEYAARLEAAGVPCELHVVPGMYHAADGIRSAAASMQDYRRRMIDALRPAIG